MMNLIPFVREGLATALTDINTGVRSSQASPVTGTNTSHAT
jgi:hypothetical protein